MVVLFPWPKEGIGLIKPHLDGLVCNIGNELIVSLLKKQNEMCLFKCPVQGDPVAIFIFPGTCSWTVG